MSTAPADVPVRDVIDLLRHQHDQIRDLFDLVEKSTGTRRREAFHRLVRLLAVHETAEEEIVHPMARRALPGGGEIVGERLAEERVAKELLAELDGMNTGDPHFLPRLRGLRDTVLAHARAEETEEFERLRDAFSESQRRGLAAAVRVAEATAPTHPHPGAESATRNLLAGPPLAVIDRVRDLIRDAMK
ncbi:hemerythrin domain-containing protein [Actinomadura viridis]|uniref:Hemerythrin superfamily protein n=1 Tax=Actinomadura viridis TaxID=58110 RepID=A0A931GSF4_9ACTN|nr:hemerythrin domain-containing protein [Actinomadura viridis]MBG6093876.1 hemerythrin superfamily protein [Actinomadura viridis]